MFIEASLIGGKNGDQTCQMIQTLVERGELGFHPVMASQQFILTGISRADDSSYPVGSRAGAA